MEEWEKKARDLFPDLNAWKLGEYFSVYSLFSELHRWCIEAHKSDNIEELHKIYDFARWCTYQDNNEVFNAIVIDFYERLIKEPTTYAAIPEWITPDIFGGLSMIYKRRLGQSGYEVLKELYKEKHPEYIDKYE